MLKEATGKVQEAIGSGAGDAMSQINCRVGQVAGTTQEFAGCTVDMARSDRRKSAGRAGHRCGLELFAKSVDRRCRRVETIISVRALAHPLIESKGWRGARRASTVRMLAD